MVPGNALTRSLGFANHVSQDIKYKKTRPIGAVP